MDPTTLDATLNAVAPMWWPIVAAGSIFLFRKPLSSALGRVSQVDVGSMKVDLQGQADNAANTTKALMGAGDGAPSSSEITRAKGQIPGSPGTAVLTAWSAVEDAVRTAAKAPSGVISPSVPDVVNGLVAQHKLDSSLVPVAHNLEGLRGRAADRPEAVSPAMATSFVAAADDLARMISSAA